MRFRPLKNWRGAKPAPKKIGSEDWLEINAKVFRFSPGRDTSDFTFVPPGTDGYKFATKQAHEVLMGCRHVSQGPKAMAGVWRVFEPGGRQVQFIIGSGDVNRDVEMTQCLHYYGSSQEEYSLEELSNLSRFGRVPAVCGEASVLVQSVLERLGHEARIVTALRLGNFNHYDNGHTVLEVRGVSGDWMVFDPGYGGWLTEGGQHVNLLTLQDSLKNLKSLAFEELRFRHYGHFFSSRLADLTFELENKWTSPNQLLNWYRETFEIVGIEMKGRPGHYEFLAPSYVEKRIVKRYSTNYHATTRDSFVAKYYSGSVTP